ncbi:MAG: hypothetical protein CL912_18895 [Deltaproteobacteria bacterium]|mgnify:CR=1 FL=1|nr:hypothetical protein [Deltaproteobacteria bacterium]
MWNCSKTDTKADDGTMKKTKSLKGTRRKNKRITRLDRDTSRVMYANLLFECLWSRLSFRASLNLAGDEDQEAQQK